MGCCNKTTRKIINIIKGSTAAALGVRFEFTDRRVRVCQKCAWNTWMSGVEHIAWLAKHGIEVITNFNQLEKLPLLPKYKQSKGRRRLYCRVCKCFVPAKARVEELKCPKSFWEETGRKE